ncbi:MAG: methylmalonyl Co-A mutase-associated GTPase MeaB [Bacteroidetes bacterium]|nr:methylmalonyl Co-A mutase-associated GTPase MeaB [Bacteroidota bacterium]
MKEFLNLLHAGDPKTIARAISLVENHSKGYQEILESLDSSRRIPVVGFTGPPGAGKSSLVNNLVTLWASTGRKVAVIAVDPASPFNFGSLLGDRLRMAGLFTHPNVFIRSLSTRGSLGGLSASIIEITDIFKNSGFDNIVIETVGVGQSEVEIAGIADTTVVVTVPEGGDEVQVLKSGVMEIADIFVVNKSDRDGAEKFAQFLRDMVHSKSGHWKIPVISTVATENTGIELLSLAIAEHAASMHTDERKYLLLAEKIEMLVARHKMKEFDLHKIALDLKDKMNKPGFNLYLYSKQFY